MRLIDVINVVEWRSLILWGDPNSPLVPRRPTIGGGPPFSCFAFLSSLCVPVGKAGCTLLGGLVSRENLTVLGMEFVIVRKSSQDHGYTGTLLDVSHPDLDDIALSTIWMHDTRAFWPLETSRDLAPCPLRSCCFQSQFGLSWEFLIPSQLSGVITWFQYARPSWHLEANILARKKSRHVYLEANKIMLILTNRKLKLPLCLSVYHGMLSRVFCIPLIVPSHMWSTPDRSSISLISDHILNLDHPIYSRSWHLDNWA